jgi:hypothetical protein
VRILVHFNEVAVVALSCRVTCFGMLSIEISLESFAGGLPREVEMDLVEYHLPFVTGSTDDYGDPEMDFVPNPRHPLVTWIESEHRKASLSNVYY